MDEKLKILIIEDNQIDKTSICRAFTNAGASREMLKVVKSKDAIDVLQHTYYDCIFLDNYLSGTQTLTLLRKVRSLGIPVPVVVLIENSDRAIIEKVIAAGATDYVNKSTLSAEILDLVTRNAITIYQTKAQLVLANQQIQQNEQLIISKTQKIEQQKQQINLQNLKLIAALELKSQFLATISHELRTPMNAIIGFSQLLLRPKSDILSHQQKQMIERILNNGKNLLLLVNEILEFSKLQAGNLDLKPEIFDITKLVKVTVEEMRSLAEAKKLSINIDINLENSILYNDSLRVQQILDKLLSNAIKFTETGSIQVKITELAHNRVELAVEDTGIGIALDNIQHIFEPFRQLDQGTNRKFGGTGLGLPIVSALVNMMGGKITIESELGKGSIFRVELLRQVSSISEREITEINYDSSLKQLVNNHQKGDYKQKRDSKHQQR
ncbi:MAG: response regulator [Richelia sp. SL_2_1]|nr:response regulator [Richelia sp. SM1_7_0]NJN08988.1 response regulator [Richelia sp. RM1_1_1]NJO26622.1 response regulator [Richelia sp. SL_2_1]